MTTSPSIFVMQEFDVGDTASIETFLRTELVRQQNWVLLYVDLRYFRAYNQFYGFVAGEQMLKALRALLEDVLPTNSPLYRVGGDEFLAVSYGDLAEAEAQEICRRWKQMRGQFYHPQDNRRGFLVGNGRRGIGWRCPLVRVCIGLVSWDMHPRPLSNIGDICSAAVATNGLARCQRQSTYVTELQLQQAIAHQREASPAQELALNMWLHARAPRGKVLVIVPDAPLAFLLQVRLELAGYEVRLSSSAREGAEWITHWLPDITIVDPEPAIKTCRYLRRLMAEPDMLLVALAGDGDRAQILESGADLFVPKPFEMVDVLFWLERLRQSHLKTVDAQPYTTRPYAPLMNHRTSA